MSSLPDLAGRHCLGDVCEGVVQGLRQLPGLEKQPQNVLVMQRLLKGKAGAGPQGRTCCSHLGLCPAQATPTSGHTRLRRHVSISKVWSDLPMALVLH